MLLHSDLKLRRWDPNVTVMNPHSVSPIRSYDDTLGGGRVLSMKPNYVMNTPMMTANNPYRALYYLPQTQSNDNSYCFTPEDIKDNINTAVKHYLLHERENMKQELVHEAMSDIRNEINHSYYIAEDQIDDEEEYGPRSERHRSTRKMMPKDSKLEKKNKTEKKKSKHRYHHHISEEEDEEEENRPLNHSSAVEDRSSKKPKRSSTAKSQDKKPRKDKKERRRGE